mmetsp:Transcript_24950/g.59275  ORF Transcript_24950/g.59275 Transcript_24950/m.59275 type:complete len:362 (-) Transcript_24950:197-1282(-)
MRDVVDGDGLLLCLPHLALKHGTEVGAAHAEQLVRIDRFALNEKCNIRQLRIVQEVPEVGDQRAAGDVDVHLRRQAELPEVIEPLLAVVAPKDVEGVVVHVTGVAETWAGHIGLLRRTGRGPHLKPLLRFEAERVQIVSRAAGAAAKEVHGVTTDHGRVRVPRRGGRHLPCGLHQAPLQRVEVELVEVIQVLCAVVTPHHQHPVFVRHGGGAVPCLRHRALHRDDGPLPLGEVVTMEVTPVVPVIPGEDVHGSVVFDTRVAVPRCRGISQSRIHHLPGLMLCVVLPEVVDAVVPVIPGKNVNLVSKGHHHVPVSGGGPCTCGVDLRPFRGLEAPLVEVVHPAAAVIPAEDVEAVPHHDARV